MPKIMEVEYSRTSRKQLLKMRLTGRLREASGEVVVYKNRTTGRLFQEGHTLWKMIYCTQ